jgi:hypothetical protein
MIKKTRNNYHIKSTHTEYHKLRLQSGSGENVTSQLNHIEGLTFSATTLCIKITSVVPMAH